MDTRKWGQIKNLHFEFDLKDFCCLFLGEIPSNCELIVTSLAPSMSELLPMALCTKLQEVAISAKS